MDSILEFIQAAWDWLYSGIYDFVVAAFVLLTKYFAIAYFKMQLFLLEIAYTAFSEIVDALKIGQFINSHYSKLDPEVRSGLSFFGIPEAFNIIFSACGTRLAMKFVPFIGR
ncbi:DUF2523 family protein [Pseudomonas sp. F1_0610]|uniref:DUF2523 family protein n=1 Tax=Pseudomonas sp. F1_0610 TaxID=3114284 RepID=UPI0039C35B1B